MKPRKSDRNFSYRLRVLLSAVAFVLSLPSARCQQPAPPPALEPTPQSPKTANAAKPARHKHSPADDFLIRGTVFTDKALAFPGAEIRIRRAAERKFRWQELTNSRGNFAIRVPQNASYEVVTQAKGFREQSKTIEAKPGLIEQSVVFQLERLGGKK